LTLGEEDTQIELAITLHMFPSLLLFILILIEIGSHLNTG